MGERPVDYGDLSEGPVTFLLMGSDQRTGKGNKGYGNFEGARSDTTMLLHIYPDRESAVVVSIPRDTIVDLPSCKDADDRVLPATRDRFNAAFDRGGPGCTLKTVEAMTGLTVDHFVVLDFNGFKKTIDALGGVEVCLTRPLQDSKSGVDLPAGRTRVSGEDALSFVRVRHNIGDGSDISRINRQQIFLSSLIQEVTGSGLLTDPLRVWRVLQRVVEVDRDGHRRWPTPTASWRWRPACRDCDRRTSRSSPCPWLPNADGATIVADQPKADAIWAALADEKPWPPPPDQGRGRREAHRDPRPDPAWTSTTRPASRARAPGPPSDLAAQGFGIGVINAREKVSSATTIRHAPDQLEAARTLQAAVPGSVLREDPEPGFAPGPDPRRDLRRGRRRSGSRRPKTGSGVGGNQPSTTAAQDICTG